MFVSDEHEVKQAKTAIPLQYVFFLKLKKILQNQLNSWKSKKAGTHLKLASCTIRTH